MCRCFCQTVTSCVFLYPFFKQSLTGKSLQIQLNCLDNKPSGAAPFSYSGITDILTMNSSGIKHTLNMNSSGIIDTVSMNGSGIQTYSP